MGLPGKNGSSSNDARPPPSSLGASSTVHDRLKEWGNAGSFERLWKEGLMEFHTKREIEWVWPVTDGAMTRAALGGRTAVPIEPTAQSQERRDAFP